MATTKGTKKGRKGKVASRGRTRASSQVTKSRPPKKPRRPTTAPPQARRPRTVETARDEVRDLARRIVDVTVAGDDAAAFALYADSVESMEAGSAPTVGIAALREKFATWRSMIRDSTWRPLNVWIDGNTIVVEWAGRITFAATGKSIDLREIAVHEVKNAKIARERFYYDRSALQP